MMDYGIMGVTIYSASCRTKEIGNITLATIGSVYKKPEDFKMFRYIIMDEAHLCNAKGGMYKDFFTALGTKLIGLTATPYRLAHNSFGSTLRFLTRTNPRVFNKVVHVTQTKDLSKQGYFCKTEYYQIKGFNRSEIQLNSTGADYREDSEKQYYTKHEFNKSVLDVVQRLLKAGKSRILVFTKFVDEARTLAEELGGMAAMVNGEMKSRERDIIIKGFRKGEIKVVANVGVLTVGFDYPELECVVIARPTRSLTLYYQMMGRAVRPHPSKEAAWIVDMCGNYQVFGRMEDMDMVEFNNNIWSVISKGRQLTNVYLDEIMKD
jgi:DNA repair protein RadD